jgi:hypothetical protein
MESIFSYVAFVKEQAEFHERKAVEHQRTKREWLHKTTAKKFRGLESAMEELQQATILRRPAGINPLALSPSDVSGLPDDLLKQLLNRPENDPLETDIVDIVNGSGGTLLIDHIIIRLYNRTGVVHDRTQLVSKIHRMNKKRLIFSAPGKKGVYTTIPPTDAQHMEIEDQPP